QPKACAAPPKRYARRWSGRSSAPPAPGHGRYRRSRYPAARGPEDRAAGPTASAARRGRRFAARTVFWPSSDFKSGRAMCSGAAVMAETGDEMVVDHAGGLHEGVDDGGANEFEPARRQLLRDPGRQRRRRRHAGGGLEVVDLGPAVDKV